MKFSVISQGSKQFCVKPPRNLQVIIELNMLFIFLFAKDYGKYAVNYTGTSSSLSITGAPSYHFNRDCDISFASVKKRLYYNAISANKSVIILAKCSSLLKNRRR
jgi:hypothetical protein